MWHLSLEWERCPDGVELVEYETIPGNTLLSGKPPGKRFRYVSGAREPVTYSLDNLEDAMALRFINATDDDTRIAFFERFGIPFGFGAKKEATPETEADHARVRKGQRKIRGWLQGLGSRQNAIAISKALGATLAPSIDVTGKSFSLALKARSLWGYMQMEVALAAVVGASYAACAHCDTAFLTGPMTYRRSHAVYCSDRCRVAAMRARKHSPEKVQ